MNVISSYFREAGAAFITGWNRFWFTPSRHETLALIRICTGLMVFYTHLVWSIDLMGFLGPEGRISPAFVQAWHAIPEYATNFGWTHWIAFNSPTIYWTAHVGGLVIVLLFTLGFATRFTSVLTFLLTVSYVHRVPGALFGLDQINTFLTMYLMLGDSGHAYSIDQWLARRRQRVRPDCTTLTNIAIRLIQIHMCIVYLFAAIGKLQGETWWGGQAMWLSLANFEYQTVDMLWLGRHPLLINLLTHVTLLWEAAYIFLVWPRYTRPIIVATSIPVHLGIAICMGMITFGLIMIVGNLAFVSPTLTDHLVRSFGGRFGGAGGQGTPGQGARRQKSVQVNRRERPISSSP